MNDSSFHLEVSSPRDAIPPWPIVPDQVNTGFREGGVYLIRKPRGGVRFLVDDEFIEDEDSHWTWSPGFYAGYVRAELLSDEGQILATYGLDVSPHPDKLGRDVFLGMLDEIWQFDPRLVLGTEPARSPVGHDGEIADPWLEYTRLRALGEQFVDSLRMISRRPIRELRAERSLLPLQYVRRADRQTALTVLRSPRLVAAVVGKGGEATTLEGLPQFDVPVAEETLDAAANRCIAALTNAVTRRAIHLRRHLATVVEREVESDTRSSMASRWSRRRDFLDGIVRKLRQAQRCSPIAEVTREELSAAGLNAVSADPAYSRAYNLGWRILRHGVEGPPSGEQLWISPTWEIYERWCFVRLSQSLRALNPDYEWSFGRKHDSGATAALVGTASEGRRTELLLQPRCPSGDAAPRSGFRSISGPREPDIVLTVSDRDGRSWYVLDAKYRTSRASVLDAMSSAHIYRDALRWHGGRPECALLLVPRGGGASWTEEQRFIDEHRVGVRVLASARDARSLLGSVVQRV